MHCSVSSVTIFILRDAQVRIWSKVVMSERVKWVSHGAFRKFSTAPLTLIKCSVADLDRFGPDPTYENRQDPDSSK
jgi:hypothetical protein